MGIGGTTGPMITGYIYDLTGSYTSAWLLNLAALVIVTLLILTLKKPAPMSACAGDIIPPGIADT
jgi:cyanate permease